jgi:hypothetical protein
VKTILGGHDVKDGTASSPPGEQTTTTTSFDQAGYDDAMRRQTLANYLTKRGKAGGGLKALFSAGVLSTAPVDPSVFTTSKVTVKPTPGKVSASSPGGALAKVIERANVLDQRKLPYQWGGGHQASTANVKTVGPVDCSGAVSAVLGINPRVSGQFERWGKPGDGGNKGVTVYANAEHVITKINGHFYGTSASNPGGGAGWIPASQITPAYLSKFTARHSDVT